MYKFKKWSSQESVEPKDASANMIFDLTAKKLISYNQEKSSEKLRESFVDFTTGLISFPLNIPGTAFHKCLQATNRFSRRLVESSTVRRLKFNKMEIVGKEEGNEDAENLLQERQANPREKQSDFFDYVLEELRKEDTILTEEMALDLMFVLLFVSFETKFPGNNNGNQISFGESCGAQGTNDQ
ncbi:hypothetical protein RHMOL_Rhmol07G0160800 [Rhododendron molle]|uniref:Uncharacterized protein n=1 Tax=Rhododendron molle TaxID=49168 RepID=A0ACC0N1V4_RHOML|nr:hypothetical protein RHMOL_Rhmol07G0160800 [Rhododendron molle]